MSSTSKTRLRFFEAAPGQAHIQAQDRYLYQTDAPQYTINIIGTGTIGQEHMRVALLLGRARVHGVYDTAKHSMDMAVQNFSNLTRSLVTENPGLKTYTDLDSACSDPDADALLICTPNHTHLDVLRVAIKSGKPIFLEKPMATTLADAWEMYQLVQGYAPGVQIGLQYRYKATYSEAIHEVFDRSSIGDVKTLSISEYRPPFLDKVNQWNKFNISSGGTLVEKCCHYFDLLNMFAAAQPERVFASGGRAVNFLDLQHNAKSSDIDDHAFVIIDYSNGVRANFTLNMFAPDFNEELIVAGDKGRLLTKENFNFHQQQASRSSISIELGEQGASRKTELAYPSLIEGSGHHGATYFEHIAFSNHVCNQADERLLPCATAQEGLWSVIVAVAAQESMASGKAIQIDELLENAGIKLNFTKI